MALESTPKTTSGASRKIRWLAIAVTVIVALYSAAWFFVASKIEDTVRAFISRPGPVAVRCDDLERIGTPFRIGFACSRTAVKDDMAGSLVSGGALRAVAHIFNPGKALVELDGPVNASFLDGTVVTANWSLLRSGFTVGFSGLKTLSLTGENVSFDLFDYGLAEPLLAKAASGEVHLRGNGADLDAALIARNLSIATKSGSEILPTLSTSTMMTLKDKQGLLEGRPLVTKRMSGELTSFKIEAAGGIYGELSGPFDIDDEGYISGEFRTRFEKLDLWEERLVASFPDGRSTISGMAALLRGLAKGEDAVTVNLVVDKGTITLSMVPIGRIPPI